MLASSERNAPALRERNAPALRERNAKQNDYFSILHNVRTDIVNSGYPF